MLFLDLQATIRRFRHLFREHGLPQRIRTDNGNPFSSTAIAGLSQLSVWWIELGIWPELTKPGSPQQNGRHERFHKTLKEATASPPAADLKAQQHGFNTFRRIYNEERPMRRMTSRLRPLPAFPRSTRIARPSSSTPATTNSGSWPATAPRA